MNRLKLLFLNVGNNKGNVFNVLIRGFPATVIKKTVAAIDGHYMSVFAGTISQHYCGITKPGTSIYDLITGVDFKCRKNGFTVLAKPTDQNMFVLHEFRDKDLVPKFNELCLLFGFCNSHDRSPVTKQRTIVTQCRNLTKIQTLILRK